MLSKMLDPMAPLSDALGSSGSEYGEYLKTSMKDPTRMGLDADYRDKGMFGKMARAEDEQAAEQLKAQQAQQYQQSLADMGAAAVEGSAPRQTYEGFYNQQMMSDQLRKS